MVGVGVENWGVGGAVAVAHHGETGVPPMLMLPLTPRGVSLESTLIISEISVRSRVRGCNGRGGGLNPVKPVETKNSRVAH